MFGDFPIGRGGDRLPPGADDKKGNMVGRKSFEVGIETEQLRATRKLYAGFFMQFACERGFNRLAFFDPAAWKMPAGPIGMANEKNLVVGCQDGALRTHG